MPTISPRLVVLAVSGTLPLLLVEHPRIASVEVQAAQSLDDTTGQADRLTTLAGRGEPRHPSVVVIGGDLAHAREHLLAGIREVVYQRSLPLATANLEFATSAIDRRAGVVGLAHLVADALLDPNEIERRLAEDGSVFGSATLAG